MFQIVPWEEEGEEGGDVVDFDERCLLQAMCEVIEGALAGEPGRVRGPGIPARRLGQKGPQRSCDPIPSFYQWEDRDAPGKGLVQGHPGGSASCLAPANNPGVLHAGRAPFPPSAPLSLCGVPLAGACARKEPLFPFSGCRRPARRWGH